MADRRFEKNHNYVINLNVNQANADHYRPILEFLQRSRVSHALSHSPPIYIQYIREFWNTAVLVAANPPYIQARVNNQDMLVTAGHISQALQLGTIQQEGGPAGPTSYSRELRLHAFRKMGFVGDENRNTFFKNGLIGRWKFLAHVIVVAFSNKKSGYDTLNVETQSQIISLVLNRPYSFSRFIFNQMRNQIGAQGTEKFLMFPRFLMMMINFRFPNLPQGGDTVQVAVMPNRIFKDSSNYRGRLAPAERPQDVNLFGAIVDESYVAPAGDVFDEGVQAQPAAGLSPPQQVAVEQVQEPIQQPVEQTVNYEPVESEHDQQTNLSNQQTSHADHDPSVPVANTGHQSCDEFGSGPNLPVPVEATENAPPHFDSYQESSLPTAQATSTQPLPLVAPLAPPAEFSCLPQTDSDKLPAYFRIHVPGLPILAEAAENTPPHFDSSQQSPPPIAQATSSQFSLPPVAPSVLPAEPLSPPQIDSVELQVSSPECGTICVQGYNVKRSVAPILEAIFKKHGDIAAECLFKTASARSYFLEVVCEVVMRIEKDDVIEKMEEIECQVSDAEAANINLPWLRAHLEAVHKRKEAMKRSGLLIEMKVNTSLVKRAAQMDLRERCEELMTAQERFEKAERCTRVLHLVENNIKNTILETKAENDLWVKQVVL